MAKLLPVLLILIGVIAGGAAGFVVRPAPSEAVSEPEGEETKDATGDKEKTSKTAKASKTKEAAKEADSKLSFIKINNQFVVPIIKDDTVTAMVVLSISLETSDSETERIYNVEPKLRDVFLQVLFDHAYSGGFNGAFTVSPNMDVLRRDLLVSAQKIVGPAIHSILITDLVRQDVATP